MTTDVGQSRVGYRPAGVLRNDVGTPGRGSSRQSGGRQKRQAEGIQFERFFPVCRSPGCGVFSCARKCVVHKVVQRCRQPLGWGCGRGDVGIAVLLRDLER